MFRDDIGDAPSMRAHRGFIEIEVRQRSRVGHEILRDGWHAVLCAIAYSA
jgi:hypothetical protein